MAIIDVDSLLAEISPESPCGKDIAYDVEFFNLERLVEGTAEIQIGDLVKESEDPDWNKVCESSLELLKSSRDLRLILYLTLAALCLEGFSGFCDGLALLCGSLERYWDDLFPRLDPDDDNDPVERMNIIGALSPPKTAMSDQDPMKFGLRLMNVPLCRPDDPRLPRPSMRDILMASGEVQTPDSEGANVPSMQLIDTAFEQAEISALKDTDQVLQRCLEHLNTLDSLLVERVGSAAAPDFSELENLLKRMQSKTNAYLERRGFGADGSLLKQIQTKMGSYLERKKSGTNKHPGEENERDDSNPGETAVQGALSGVITSKEEVLKALEMIVNYYEQNEPSSPVPLLIKRAKRLVGRSFMDIIRDLSPDAVSQVKMVSGEEEESAE